MPDLLKLAEIFESGTDIRGTWFKAAHAVLPADHPALAWFACGDLPKLSVAGACRPEGWQLAQVWPWHVAYRVWLRNHETGKGVAEAIAPDFERALMSACLRAHHAVREAGQ